MTDSKASVEKLLTESRGYMVDARKHMRQGLTGMAEGELTKGIDAMRDARNILSRMNVKKETERRNAEREEEIRAGLEDFLSEIEIDRLVKEALAVV
jgi:hypothetical protein